MRHWLDRRGVVVTDDIDMEADAGVQADGSASNLIGYDPLLPQRAVGCVRAANCSLANLFADSPSVAPFVDLRQRAAHEVGSVAVR